MKAKIKVLIDLPKYINSSNGTKCINDLARKLEAQNITTIKIIRNDSFFSKLKNKLKLEFSSKGSQIIRAKAQKGDWFLACDSTPSNLLREARKYDLKIIWWQLAPYQFLGSNQIPKVGDYSLPFSSYTDPESDMYFYYQPDLDPEWEKALEKTKSRKRLKKLKICLYNGKGRLCVLNNKIKDLLQKYQIEIITRSNPKRKSDYFNLLLGCDGVISFDEMTQSNLEAASLGIPVYLANPLFPGKCIKKFNIQGLEERITSSPEIFISMLSKKSLPFNSFEVDYLKSFNNSTIERFIDIFNGDNSLKPLQKKEIISFRKYSKSLISKKVISPYINSGQSPSSLLIKFYVNNLVNKNKNKNIIKWILVFDNVGHILYKLGLIRICEIFVLKIKSVLKIRLLNIFY